MKTYCKILVASLFTLNMTSHATSFNCNSSNLSKAESHICNTPELSKLDSKLGETYEYARTVATDEDHLKQFAKERLASRNKVCDTDTACLSEWYQYRIRNYSNWKDYQYESRLLSDILFE